MCRSAVSVSCESIPAVSADDVAQAAPVAFPVHTGRVSAMTDLWAVSEADLPHALAVASYVSRTQRAALDALPQWLEPGDAEAFIRDLVGALREGRIPTSDVEAGRDEYARIAAAKAVRLPRILGEAAAMELIRELFSTSAPVVGPRGHPTFVELNHGELARRFQK